MKKIIITPALVFCITLAATAQRTAHPAKTKDTLVAATPRTIPPAKVKDTLVEISSDVPFDNRKIYMGEDGQAATVTGHEAASINGNYVSIKKDPAPAPKPKKQ